MRIKTIVEGYGEVKALPELLRRVGHEAGLYDLQSLPAIRVNRSDFLDSQKLERWVGIAKADGPNAILILLDADSDCPVELAQRISVHAVPVSQPIPLEVVVANKEYEAWFLAAVHSLRGKQGISIDATYSGSPEAPRDAKGRLSKLMHGNQVYSPTVDQVKLTASFDMALAYKRSRSFRRLVRAAGLLFASAGHPLGLWPPAGW